MITRPLQLDTFKFYDEHINISYYPAHDLNANYGAFSLNKLPSLAIKTADGSEICDENGETLNDMASLVSLPFFFLKIDSAVCEIPFASGIQTRPSALYPGEQPGGGGHHQL